MLNIDDIPPELAARSQWMVWRYQPNPKKPGGKLLKVPYWANGKLRTGTQGDKTDRARLATLETAMATLQASQSMGRPFTGIGFAFLPDDGLIGIDIDKCIDGDTGEMAPMACELITECASYTERSPSGTGLHIIVSGHTVTFKSDVIGLEVFCSSQFFTFSGNHFSDTPKAVMPIREAVLEKMRALVEAARIKPGSSKAPSTGGGPASPAPPGADDERRRLESALAYIPSDQYDVWIKIGAALFGALGEDGFRVWDYWSSRSAAYGNTAECAAKWHSFAKSGVTATAASVFYIAQQHGWKPPRGHHLELVTPASPVPPPPLGERKLTSAGQSPRNKGEELSQAGAKAPEPNAAMPGQPDSFAEAIYAAIYAAHHVANGAPVALDDILAASHDFADVPVGESADLFPEGGRGGKDKPKKVYGQDHWDRVNKLLASKVLIYGEDLAWDEDQRMLMKISALKTIVSDSDVMKFWGGDARRWVLKKNIVFDPTETPSPAASGPLATINLFNGWRMRPRKGKWTYIEALLLHLCDANEDLYLWILRWIAYPLRNRGAKMTTSIIMHGDEGSGKNIFFEKIVKRIYGEYGYVIGNAQLEGNFNDWASKKLFIVADEVVTKAELRQMKGRLKVYVAGDVIIVNPKGLPEHSEKNQINFVFLSNELVPLALDHSDRRYLVVWTPPALPLSFYASVMSEVDNGGVEAFYHYLLNDLDMGDFNEHTKPLLNEAKSNLMEKTLSPPERFFKEWKAGLLPLPFINCAVGDAYSAFKIWASRSGESAYTTLTIFSPSVVRYAKGELVGKTITYDVGSGVKQRTVFLIGPQEESKTLREQAEGPCALFSLSLDKYRRNVDTMDTT
jgi:hypothetical protein